MLTRRISRLYSTDSSTEFACAATEIETLSELFLVI
jgi:hypothetical protein